MTNTFEALAAIGCWIRDVATALAAPAIGASVSLVYRPALTWGQRAAQFGVGIAVSWYGGLGINAVYPVDPFVLQSIRFVLGMIAYEATPRFKDGLVALIAALPAEMKDRLLAGLDRLLNMVPSKPKDIEP